MAKKAWDKIRDVSHAPIGTGYWETFSENLTQGQRYGVATIDVSVGKDRSARLEISQTFNAAGLREVAEFCIELSHQLEKGCGE